METEDKEGCSRCTKVAPCPTSPTSPSLNLMEQLLLAKMERQTVSEDHEGNRHGEFHLLSKKKTLLLRTDSMDSQTSASTFSSILSNDSASSSRYCRCDDCLLGIADRYQQNPLAIGRKKVFDDGNSLKTVETSHRMLVLGNLGISIQFNVYFWLRRLVNLKLFLGFILGIFKIKTILICI